MKQLGFFSLVHVCMYALKQFSLHIHEAHSLSIRTTQDFNGFNPTKPT